jgi:hypothetical protein
VDFYFGGSAVEPDVVNELSAVVGGVPAANWNGGIFVGNVGVAPKLRPDENPDGLAPNTGGGGAAVDDEGVNANPPLVAAGTVDGVGANEKPPEATLGAAKDWIGFAVVVVVDPKPNAGCAFNEPNENDGAGLAFLSTVGVGFIPNEGVVPNESVGLELIVEIIADVGGLIELLAPNTNAGLLAAAAIVVVVVDAGARLKLLLPNTGAADIVVVDGNVKPVGTEKALATEDTGNALVVVVVTDVVGREPNKFEVVAVAVVKDGIEEVSANVKELVGLDETVDTTGVADVVVAVIAELLNCPKGVDADTCDDVGRLAVVVTTGGIVEPVTAVVRFVDDVEPKGWNAVPNWNGVLILVAGVVPNKNGALVVTGFSLVVAVIVVVPNAGKVWILNEALVVTGFSFVIAVLNEGGVLVVIEFSLVVVDGIIGAIPKNGWGALIDTGFSFVVGGDTIGEVPNDRLVELVVIGVVVIVGLSLVVADNDVVGVVPNDGKLRPIALVVTAGGIDKTFALVVVGIVGIVVVTGVDILVSFAITSGNLLDDTGSFSVVTGDSIAE